MDDRRTSRQIEVLRDLGCPAPRPRSTWPAWRWAPPAAAPFSSYRVAQDMGRDPANIGKIFNGLIRLQAVRVVQEGPRLFAVVPPDEFTAHLVGRVRRHGAEAVDPAGIVRAGRGRRRRPGPDEPRPGLRPGPRPAGRLPPARFWSAAHQRRCANWAPTSNRRRPQPGRRVRVLTPEPMSSAVVDIGQLPPAGRVGQDAVESWLHLVVDGHAWLTALLQAEAGRPGALRLVVPRQRRGAACSPRASRSAGARRWRSATRRRRPPPIRLWSQHHKNWTRTARVSAGPRRRRPCRPGAPWPRRSSRAASRRCAGPPAAGPRRPPDRRRPVRALVAVRCPGTDGRLAVRRHGAAGPPASRFRQHAPAAPSAGSDADGPARTLSADEADRAGLHVPVSPPRRVRQPGTLSGLRRGKPIAPDEGPTACVTGSVSRCNQR